MPKYRALHASFFPSRSDCSTLGAEEAFPTNAPQSTLKDPVLAANERESETLLNWQLAAEAADSRKATDLKILDLRPVTSFTDYFVICSVANVRQGQAVCDEIEKQLKTIGERAVSIEGYETGEWILMDYGDFLVHIFSATARSYYDLERLWRHAETINFTLNS